jgi:uncharacterized protein
MAIRAVLDTNIWVSAILNPFGFPATLRRAFENGSFQCIVSEPILLELAEVLNRPRIRKKYAISEDDIRELLVLIEERAEHVLLAGTVSVCRDTDDNLVIETAIRGQAQYLVTRDDDIKLDKTVASYLQQFNIAINSTAQFLARLQQS